MPIALCATIGANAPLAQCRGIDSQLTSRPALTPAGTDAYASSRKTFLTCATLSGIRGAERLIRSRSGPDSL
jgi:hypothetical protein